MVLAELIAFDDVAVLDLPDPWVVQLTLRPEGLWICRNGRGGGRDLDG